MKKILILNGSPRKNGRTASLKNAFVEGAQRVGHEIKEYYLTGMNIRPCLACEYCQLHDGVCVQKDDMVEVTEAFGWKNPGNILGAGKELQAELLGASI